MKTTLPDLFYSPTGIIWDEATHSSAYSNPRRYPRTDLESLLPWNEFETEIHQVITSHMADMNIPPGAEYDLGAMPKEPQVVSEEEDVRSEAKVQLHDLVKEVLRILGIEGRFQRSCAGNNQIIGAPDFSWLRNLSLHPKFVVRITDLDI